MKHEEFRKRGCIHKSDWQVAVLLRLVDRTCQAHPAGIFRTFSKKGGNGGFAPSLVFHRAVIRAETRQNPQILTKIQWAFLVDWLTKQDPGSSCNRWTAFFLRQPQKNCKRTVQRRCFHLSTKSEPERWTTILFSSPDLQKLLVHPRERAPCSCGTCWIGCTPFFAPQICLEKRGRGSNLMVDAEILRCEACPERQADSLMVQTGSSVGFALSFLPLLAWDRHGPWQWMDGNQLEKQVGNQRTFSWVYSCDH